MRHEAGRSAISQTSATAFCDNLAKTVEAMITILNKEAEEIRHARYEDAFLLSDQKSRLAGQYAQGLATLRSHGKDIGALAPNGADRLRQLHGALEAALQSNMTVLTTARTVSETLLRDLTTSATSKQRTTSYGQDARTYSGSAPVTAVGYNAAT